MNQTIAEIVLVVMESINKNKALGLLIMLASSLASILLLSRIF